MMDHDWFPRSLPENVVFGDRTWLYSSYAFLHYRSRRACGVRVGRDSGLYDGTFFDLGPDGEVEIGDYCAVVGAIISTNGRVAIGDYAFIAHKVVLADRPVATPGDGPAVESRGIEIGAKVWIGARAILLGGARVGEGAIVGAGAVVDGAVPPYAIAAGNPARIVGSAASEADPGR